MLARTVKVVQPYDLKKRDDHTQPFDQYLEIPNLVVLGDPGAGKTHLFKRASVLEQGCFYTARQFVTYGDSSCTGKVLYIDALDEKRPRTDSPQSIDVLISKINALKPKKVRVACRAADWLGETDLEIFKPYFEASGGYAVLSLNPLSEEEIDAILSEHGIKNAFKFRMDAEKKGVSFLLVNPQTLIMLAESIKDGNWPATKRELFDNSVKLLLTEHNRHKSFDELGQVRIDELIDVAGLICAISLISDSPEVCLLENTVSGNSPSYSTIPFEQKKVLSALTRRAFIYSGDDRVICTHRTIAEYLGALWLTGALQNGLSFRRLISLITANGQPTSELRGLHAWLATLCQTHSKELLLNDPYGVLVYGDVSNLDPSNRRFLFQKIVDLSIQDPWFRANDWTRETIGALSSPDLHEEFRQILNGDKHNFHLRSVVFDAIRHGPPLPELTHELVECLCSENLPFSERYDSFKSLINIGPQGIDHIIQSTKTILFGQQSSARLRGSIIGELYEGNFEPADVVHVLKDELAFKKSNYHGGMQSLASRIPIEDIPDVLNGIIKICDDKEVLLETHNQFELEYFIRVALERLLAEKQSLPSKCLYSWLLMLKNTSGNHESDKIKDWLSQHPSVVQEMFENVLHEVCAEDVFWHAWNEFTHATMYTLDNSELLKTAFEQIKGKHVLDEKDQQIFDLVLSNCLQSDPPNFLLFNVVYEFGSLHPELSESIRAICQSSLSDWRHRNRVESIQREIEREHGRKERQKSFQKESEEIRDARQLGWLGWIAMVYFCRFSDVDRNATEVERLETELGPTNTTIALEGLRRLVEKLGLPTPKEVGLSNVRRKYYRWWLAVVAGLDECWAKQPNLNIYDQATLKSALAINLVHRTRYDTSNTKTTFKRDWVDTLLAERPKQVLSVYGEIIRISLQHKEDHPPGIHETLNESAFESYIAEFALGLLTDFPNTHPQNLKQLISTVISDRMQRSALVALGLSILAQPSKVKGDQRAIWYSTIFVLAFEQLKSTGRKYICKGNRELWILKDIVGRATSAQNEDSRIILSGAQIAFVARAFAKKYKNVSSPEDGWSGDENPWDASSFVISLINRLSTYNNDNSTKYLTEFASEGRFSSYSDHVRHAQFSQKLLRWRSQFIQPNWDQTIESLENFRPAHMSELRAMTLDCLDNICNRIRYSNTDTYKIFWNEEGHTTPTSPKPEDTCRDRLVELLRPFYEKYGIRVEPEGHMLNDKRADIVILPPPGQKLPLELKRNYHPEVWTACRNQLDRLYARDLEANGYGLYVVFWFGNEYNKTPLPPKQPISERPETAIEFEQALRRQIPREDRHRLEVVVIDATRPPN